MDHAPTPEEARTAVAKFRVTAAKSAGQPTMGAEPDTGVLGAARQMYRKAFPPQPQRLDSNLATVAGMNIAPEDLLMVGQAGRAVAGAAKASGGVIGAAKEVVTQTTPIVKYEATKHVLTSVGIPESVAIPIAMAVSGYKRGAKPEPVAPESPASALPPSAASGGTTPPPAPTPRPTRPGGSTPPAVSQPRMATPGNPAMDEIGDRMAGGPDMPSKGNGTPSFDVNSMSPQEKIQALKWYEAGVKPEVIVQRIEGSRQFSGTLNTATPDEAANEAARMAREAAKRRKPK